MNEPMNETCHTVDHHTIPEWFGEIKDVLHGIDDRIVDDLDCHLDQYDRNVYDKMLAEIRTRLDKIENAWNTSEEQRARVANYSVGMMPCPKCNVEPEMVRKVLADPWGGSEGVFFNVKCPKCGLETYLCNTKRVARESWNESSIEMRRELEGHKSVYHEAIGYQWRSTMERKRLRFSDKA
jgi:hypothetical protein